MEDKMGSAASDINGMKTPQRKNGKRGGSESGGGVKGTIPAGGALSSPILQADELCLNPRWSPHLKSPPSSLTLSARLRSQSSPMKASTKMTGESSPSYNGTQDGPHTPGGMTSPLSKRAKFLQSASSPENLPPLSPIVSSKKKYSLRSDLTQDTPFPFSPTSSGLRIKYSTGSPLSPTMRATPNRREPESPTLSRTLIKESPALSLDDKLGAAGSIGGSGIGCNDDDESPTLSQMSRSLLFRLDLESPTTRRGLTADEGDAANGSSMSKRTSNILREVLGAHKITNQKRITASASNAVPQIFASAKYPRIDQTLEKEIAKQLEAARKHFDSNFGAHESDFVKVTESCGLPRFANRALFRFATRNYDSSATAETTFSPFSGNKATGKRTRQSDNTSWPSFAHFCDVWARARRASNDEHALLFNILLDEPTASNPTYLTREDIKPLVTDVVDHHYELEFLEGQDQFARSYAETVIERIFYVANRSWDGRLKISQFRKANITGMLKEIEEGIDVDIENPGVFSYKHFYVLFCSFFELDSNHDKLLDARDLLRYFSGSLTRRMISRIMMGKGKPSEHASIRDEKSRSRQSGKSRNSNERKKHRSGSRYDLNVKLSDCRMTYRDFIWFLLSEIDKTSPTALEYWFRCLDLDGDGVISVYELEYFYDEQIQRMELDMTSDIIMLDDLMCQLCDLVNPERNGLFTIKDLRKVTPTMLPLFFDAFMNLPRFVEHESRTAFLQRQLAQLSARALPSASFSEVISLRMEFLGSLPNPWVEFADIEYAALLNDHEQYDQQAGDGINDTEINGVK